MSEAISSDVKTEIAPTPEDWSGTNFSNSTWGAAGTDLLRLAPSENGENGEMPSADRPYPWEISHEVAQQSESTANSSDASDFLWVCGKFVEHDLSLTEAGSAVSANIEVPVRHPFFDPFFTGEVEIGFNRVDGHGGAYADISTRPEDGSGTNFSNSTWGATGTDLLRLAPSENGENGEMSGADRPNAREISNEIAQQSESTANSSGASDFLWIWGQFVDHDLSLTEAGSTVSANIEVPLGDPFFDPFFTGEVEIGFSRVDEHDGTYVNEVTAFMDASMIYGSTAEKTDAMRVDGGKLIMTEEAQLELEGATLLTGDVRAAENIALSSMHTIFTREHNRIVDELADENPQMSDDALFATARAHVEGIIQAITFNEFLPILLGEGQFEAYTGYDDTVNPGISVEFSTAVYRLGHTLLSGDLQLVSENGKTIEQLALRDAFFTPSLLREENLIEDLLRGAATQTAQAVDTMVVEDVRSFLFGPPGAGGFDLAALNIQRGRDLGVASYNNLREALGLDRAEDFLDITSDADLAARLEAVYGSVDLVDAWVGGLAEDPVNGALLGEMFSLVVVDQFTRLRDGDAFWSEGRSDLSEEVITELWDTTLSDVILRNTDVDVLQSNVFMAMNRVIGTSRSDKLIGDDDADFIWGAQGADKLSGRGGNDELRAGDGDDRIWGDDGDDRLFGGAGQDLMFGGTGDDRLAGGNGDDRIWGDDGDDHLFGGAGQDRLVGGSGDDRLAGGDGDDRIWGGDGDDRLFGGAGQDLMFGGSGDDRLAAGDGDDRIWGGDGDDRLFGGAGNDHLSGGLGDDILTGGADQDVFDFNMSQLGSDTVTDFDLDQDILRLNNLDHSKVDFFATEDGDLILAAQNGLSITFVGLADDFCEDHMAYWLL